MKRSGQIFDKAGDRRFCETEEAIFNVFADPDVEPNIRVFTSRAGISSSTFYRHHQSVYTLLHDYEQMIMEQFRQFMHETINYEKVGFRQTIYRMLMFIILNKDVIGVVASRDNYLIFYLMVRTLRSRVNLIRFECKNVDKIFDVYVCEVCGVIKNWHEDGYPEQALKKVEKDIIYLSLTIEKRLGKLAN